MQVAYVLLLLYTLSIKNQYYFFIKTKNLPYILIISSYYRYIDHFIPQMTCKKIYLLHVLFLFQIEIISISVLYLFIFIT